MKIVLDADGVLLNYNQRMAQVYEMALGKSLSIVKESHHFTNMYGVNMTKEERSAVFALFDTHGWSSMPAIEGAIEATQALHNAGCELLCLSSMPPKFVQARAQNLKNLGIPVKEVIGSGRDDRDVNPKAAHLITIQPDIFVDDQLRNFKNVPDTICKIWIDNQYHDSPDIGLNEDLAHFKFNTLIDFTRAFLDNPSVFTRRKNSLKI